MIYLLFLVFALLLTFVGMQFISILLRGYAPFVSSDHSIIKAIAKEVSLQPSDVVYELGAGDAPLLLELYHKFPNAKYVGLENAFLPWLIGNIQIFIHRCKIELRHKNFYKVSLADANLIYCYLNPGTMKKLEEKFKAECKPGTRIISLSFKLPNTEPQRKLEIEGSEIFFYTL
jgi:hypothetical protein